MDAPKDGMPASTKEKAMNSKTTAQLFGSLRSAGADGCGHRPDGGELPPGQASWQGLCQQMMAMAQGGEQPKVPSLANARGRIQRMRDVSPGTPSVPSAPIAAERKGRIQRMADIARASSGW
jgi:hypothetical protein